MPILLVMLNFNLCVCFLQVNVEMEYSRKVSLADGPAAATGIADREMDFGSVYVAGDDASGTASSTGGNQPNGLNIAELLVGRGFATVIRHRDFEERSNQYDALLAAESRAISGKKGIHSAKDPPVMHITDLLSVRNTTKMGIVIHGNVRSQIFFMFFIILLLSGIFQKSKRLFAIPASG